MPPERKGSGIQQFKELPTPKEKITTQLFNELLKDRGKFVRKETTNMERQNPYLLAWFNIFTLTSPDPELSQDWGLLYYSIHSRSTGQKDMPKVTKELVDAKHGEWTQIYESEGIGNLAQEYEAQKNRIIEVDKQRSPGLELYWGLMNYKKQQLEASGRYSPKGTEIIFTPLYILAGLLRSQTDTNRLKNQIPDV